MEIRFDSQRIRTTGDYIDELSYCQVKILFCLYYKGSRIG